MIVYDYVSAYPYKLETDMERGIYQKFRVTRVDGSSEPGGKHEHCAYYVLDLEHDPYAIPALRAYANACRRDNPELADDIDSIVSMQPVNCACREANCPHTPFSFGPATPNEMARYLMRSR